MSHTKIAVAQIGSKKGDITTNIERHITAVEAAAKLGVSYIMFPELSLTGYEPELAEKLAFCSNDSRLKPLIDATKKFKLTIAVGAPIKTKALPTIGLMIISPNTEVMTYEKIFLHPGEEAYFSAGTTYNTLIFGNLKIANAICADTNNQEHINTYLATHPTAYMASMLVSESGYPHDSLMLAKYAKQHNILVAMANHSEQTGGWTPAGQSAIWTSEGLLSSAPAQGNALVIAEHTATGWLGQVSSFE